jgi:hypothetical protein
VPDTVPGGVFDVVVTDPSSAAATLPRAYTVITGSDVVYAGGSDLWVSPNTIRAGQEVQLGVNLHRIGGKATIDVPVSFFLGDPNAGGTLIGTFSVLIVPNDPSAEIAWVNWDVGSSLGPQTIFAEIDPSHTLTQTQVTDQASWTFTVLAPAADSIAPEITNLALAGGAPQTSDRNVTVALAADDNGGGDAVTSMLFIDQVFNQGAQGWYPIQQTGWIPFASNTTITLANQAGIHYIQAFVADAAGNISIQVFKAQIDYVPAPPTSDSLKSHQVREYRQSLNVGDGLTVDVHPLTGDPDLYVYGPDNNEVKASNNSGLVDDSVSFVAQAQGTYQIEVYAFTDTTYTMTINGVAQPSVSRLAQSLPCATPSAENPQKCDRPNPAIPVNDEPAGQEALPVAPVESATVTSTPTVTGTATQPAGPRTSRVYLPIVLDQATENGW